MKTGFVDLAATHEPKREGAYKQKPGPGSREKLGSKAKALCQGLAGVNVNTLCIRSLALQNTHRRVLYYETQNDETVDSRPGGWRNAIWYFGPEW